MNYFIKFSCGDLVSVRLVRCYKDEVCVQMEYGPIWVAKNRLIAF